MKSNWFPKYNKLLIIFIIIIFLIVVGFLAWIYILRDSNMLPLKEITSYEDCKKSAGSKMLLTYPGQCITADGKSFTDPSNNTDIIHPGGFLRTFCAEGERLCFDYPNDWTVKKVTQNNSETGSTGDELLLANNAATLSMRFRSGIGGIGGSCDDESKTTVYVQNSTEIPKMTGFKSDYSMDTLRVARVVYTYPGDDKYIASLYVTGDADYTIKQNINRCGIFLSPIIKGRYAKFSSESNDPGAFEFGVIGTGVENQFDSLDAAEQAFSSEAYEQAATILESLHYE